MTANRNSAMLESVLACLSIFLTQSLPRCSRRLFPVPGDGLLAVHFSSMSVQKRDTNNK